MSNLDIKTLLPLRKKPSRRQLDFFTDSKGKERMVEEGGKTPSP